MENSIKFIRLVTGEDLIAETIYVEAKKQCQYTLINPLKVLYMTGSKPGILSISLMQWVFHRICEEQEFTIREDDIITIAEPSESMIDYYYTSVEHFVSYKAKLEEQTEYEDVMFEGEQDENDAVEAILDLIKSRDRGKLH